MSDRHYLLKVIGLSAIPRVVTATLTIVTFPLMMRALGADGYGVVVFIVATTAVLESFVDFGASAAAGKEIAAARESGVTNLGAIVRVWARLQLTIAGIG